MSHVVTSYQWAWRSNTDAEEVMNWVGQMSELGWELKGLTATVHTTTVRPGYDEQFENVRAFMQRPLQTTNALQRWQYPG